MDLALHRTPLRVLAERSRGAGRAHGLRGDRALRAGGLVLAGRAGSLCGQQCGDGRRVRRLRLRSWPGIGRAIRSAGCSWPAGSARARRPWPRRWAPCWSRPALPSPDPADRDGLRLVLAVGDRALHPARPAAVPRRSTADAEMAPGDHRGDRHRPAVQSRDGGRPGTDGSRVSGRLSDAAVLRRAAAAVAAHRAARPGRDPAGPGRTGRPLPSRHRSRPAPAVVAGAGRADHARRHHSLGPGRGHADRRAARHRPDPGGRDRGDHPRTSCWTSGWSSPAPCPGCCCRWPCWSPTSRWWRCWTEWSRPSWAGPRR